MCILELDWLQVGLVIVILLVGFEILSRITDLIGMGYVKKGYCYAS